MMYDLWDIEARFFFDRYDSYDSEEVALGVVRALLDERGDDYADDLELVIGEGGQENLSGTALIRRARSVANGNLELEERVDRLAGESTANGATIPTKETAPMRR